MSKTQLKKLTAQWYQKLKDSGFEDIEDSAGNLKQYHSIRFLAKNIRTGFNEKQRYYELASQLLYSFPFKDKRMKNVWKLHAAGLQVPEIASALKISEESVRKTISYLAGHIKGV